ncbi:MAG: hypothetical protein AAF682_15615 [Planctomycetota bacterium]
MAALHALTFLGAAPLDDEYILYRYAHNLLAGEGLVFNAGERVEGYTQPLWLLLLSAARALGLAPVAATRLLGIASAALAVYATAEAWRLRFPRARVPAPALLLAALPAFAFHAVAGLGTPLLAALLACWAWAWARDEERGAPGLLPAALLGLAGLARPEAVVFLVPYLAVEAQRGRLARALPALVPLAGWTAFRVAYYGRLLPITYHVKKLPPLVDLGYGLDYLVRATLECGVLVAALLALFALARNPVSLGRALGTAALGAVLHVGYVLWVGGDYMPFARFSLPALPLLLIAACAGLRGRFLRRPAALRAFLIAALLLPQWTQLGPRSEVFALHEANEERWIAVGQTLAERVAPGTSVAVSAVGAIGFHSELPIVDLLGMTNHAIAEAAPDLVIEIKGHHRHDADWVLAQRPDLIVLGSGGRLLPGTQTLALFRWEEGVLAHPEFERSYRTMAMPVAGSYPLYFFLRDGAPRPAGAVPVGG